MKSAVVKVLTRALPLAIAIWGTTPFLANAAPLSIGLAADVTSMDPHFHLYVPNQNIADHVYDRLIIRDDKLAMTPGLALSWKAIDELTWELKLRGNVKFHDGSPFTSEDVKFTLERVPTVKDSPGLFTTYTRAFASVEAVDPLTVRIKTTKPHPLAPNDLAIIPIISKKAATGATTADFNSGKAAIGTGPYKLTRFARGDRIELARNDAYWGVKPSWETVTFRIMTNDASRVSALLSGDVQAIDSVPVADMSRIKKEPSLQTVARTGYRLIYLAVNQSEGASVHFSDKKGAPLNVNPLRDLKVRRAIDKAISRESLLGRVMDGAATTTGQLINSGLPGYISDLPTSKYDPEGARKLLAEAGYPDGFNMTLSGPNNRYLMDDQLLQAIAQMLARVGITAKVEAMPAATFFPKNNKGEFALSLVGWAPDSAEASSPLRALIASKDPAKGYGNFNVGYSNKTVDELIDRAMVTIVDSSREKLLQQATRMAMDDVAVIPLHHQATIWGMSRTVAYPGRADERTYAFRFTPNAVASKP
ncbi:ABC transporter substrate-binding protein [Polaromonas sp. YR568]|uniref:ABC transporter substrate-binding protein n=1 Tax=Polaromonas sp. YR568 TaxID=1855301 RepID=UPI00398BFAAB